MHGPAKPHRHDASKLATCVDTNDPKTNVTNGDVVLTGAHLKEFPDYYTRLARLETEADAYWASAVTPRVGHGRPRQLEFQLY